MLRALLCICCSKAKACAPLVGTMSGEKGLDSSLSVVVFNYVGFVNVNTIAKCECIRDERRFRTYSQRDS